MSDNTSAKGLAREIAQTLKEEPKGKTSPYDTTATVNRIEGGTAWVSIPGGVDETPVQLTVNAKEGDSVQVRVAGGKAWITGNGTAPPTDDQKANEANENAIYAQTIAENAEGSARRASLAADVAEAKAQAASDAAEEAWDKADDAETAAGQAQTAAQKANTAANGTLTSLSTVQDVIGMLNWAQENASYSLTQDTDIVPGKTYWTRSGAGTEADPYEYTPVTNPVKTDLSIYYEVSGVDEAMGDFISAHLALTDEGLWILPDGMDAQSYRVLIATGGQGHTYEDAGTYIIDSSGKTVAKLGEVITLGIDDGSQSYMTLDYHSMRMIDKEGDDYLHISDLRDKEGYITYKFTGSEVSKYHFSSRVYPYINFGYAIEDVDYIKINNAIMVDEEDYYWPTHYPPSASEVLDCVLFENRPEDEDVIEIRIKLEDCKIQAYTFGKRNTFRIGAFSFVAGYNTGMGDYSFAEGFNNLVTGTAAHAEGSNNKAVHSYSHAEGCSSEAYGENAHVQNLGTITRSRSQTAIGEYNSQDYTGSSTQRGTYALIIGNGTEQNRSNAFTVDWSGNVRAAGSVTENNGTRDIDLNISEATIQKYVDLGMSLA